MFGTSVFYSMHNPLMIDTLPALVFQGPDVSLLGNIMFRPQNYNMDMGIPQIILFNSLANFLVQDSITSSNFK